MSAPLRLVLEPVSSPPCAEPRRLSSVDELEPLLRGLLQERFEGELRLRGPDTARICLSEGRIPWVRAEAYPEHLGHVLRRELGVREAALRRAIAHCRALGCRLGEGLLALGLVRPAELRDCLYRHVSDQLWEILAWAGPVLLEIRGWPHRYDPALMFELDELLRRSSAPGPDERLRLGQLVARCRERLPGLALACVIEVEEGVPLDGVGADDPVAQDLLGLCTVGLRRLVAHRVTHPTEPPASIVLNAPDGCIVVQRVPWAPEWLLLLGGAAPSGRMLTVAQAAVRDA